MTRKGRLIDRIGKEILLDSEARLVARGLDVVGDIAIVKIPDELEERRFELGQALLREGGPSIKVVLRQVSPVSGKYRVRVLEWLAGEKRTTTIYREYGCQFRVDLDKAYFSPRLAYERMRVAELIQQGGRQEDIVNMFAGVGSFSIIIAKHCKVGKVYSIDINPDAVRLMEENIRLNKVQDEVVPIEGDARAVIETQLKGVADRVLMPLPERAYEYLDVAVLALRDSGWIHYYDFTHAKGEDPQQKVTERMAERMRELGFPFDLRQSRIVRDVGPNWFQVVADIFVEGKSPSAT